MIHEVGSRRLREGNGVAWAHWRPKALRSLASKLPIIVTNEWCRGGC